MIRCRAAFRLHDFGRSTSPVGALEDLSAANDKRWQRLYGIYYGAATEEWFSHSRSADVANWSDLFLYVHNLRSWHRGSLGPLILSTRASFLPGNEKHGFAGDIHAFPHCQQVLLISRPWEKFHPHFTSDCETQDTTGIHKGSFMFKNCHSMAAIFGHGAFI